MREQSVTATIGALGGFLVGLAALIGVFVSLKRGQRGIQKTSDEIHVYVNSRMTEVVEYVKELKKVLEDNDISVPPPVEHPASGAYQQATGAHAVDTSIQHEITKE